MEGLKLFEYNFLVAVLLLIESKNPVNQRINRVKKYSRRESNPHVLKHWILNPARLPIPPLEQTGGKNKQIFGNYLIYYPAIFLNIAHY